MFQLTTDTHKIILVKAQALKDYYIIQKSYIVEAAACEDLA